MDGRRLRLAPWKVDACLAVFFTALAQVELSMGWDDGYHDGQLWLNRPLQVLVTAPLLLRSARPRLTFTLMCAAIAVPALLTARTVLFWGDMLPLTLVVFTVARARADAWSWAAAPVATAGCAVVALHNDEMPLTDAPFALVLFGAAALVGRLVGHLTEQRHQLAAALAQLAREQELREEAAVQEERRRIAVEMHDVVAHAVSLMTIQVGAVRLQLESDGQGVPGQLRAAEEAGRRALAELRRALGVMRTAGSEGDLAPVPGLADLPALVATYADSGLEVSTQVETAPDLPDSLQLAAYRIVQESLTNVARHAGSAGAVVSIVSAGHELVVSVLNQPGSGAASPDSARAGGAGHGLAGMRERVTMFAGRLEAGPTPAGGFSVVAQIPIPEAGPLVVPAVSR